MTAALNTRVILGSIPPATTTFASPAIAKEPAAASAPFDEPDLLPLVILVRARCLFGRPSSSSRAAALDKGSVTIPSPMTYQAQLTTPQKGVKGVTR